MLAALGAIFGIGFRFIQQPSSNVNQPPSQPVVEIQPVQQPPSQPVVEIQPVQQPSEHATEIMPIQQPSKPKADTYNNPCAQQNNCNPTIENQVRELGRQIDPSTQVKKQVKKLDPTGWGW
jgi:hypothetical protein